MLRDTWHYLELFGLAIYYDHRSDREPLRFPVVAPLRPGRQIDWGKWQLQVSPMWRKPYRAAGGQRR